MLDRIEEIYFFGAPLSEWDFTLRITDWEEGTLQFVDMLDDDTEPNPAGPRPTQRSCDDRLRNMLPVSTP